MTHDELVEEFCEENGYKICPLTENVGNICYNPVDCEHCNERYITWLCNKELNKRYFKKAYMKFFEKLNFDKDFCNKFNKATLGCQIKMFEDILDEEMNK